jgi:transcriptional regulator with XRE-family HTH domain
LSKGSFLAELRKRAGLTQRQLGRNIGMPASYGQKKVSQWESGFSTPSAKQITKLAKELEIPSDQLATYFADPNSHSAVELVSHLAALKHPALFAVCYSGRPRTFLDSFLRATYAEAFRKHLYVALFVPFPLTLRDATPDSSLLLTGYNSRVWGSVFALYEKLRDEIKGSAFDSHLATYGPRIAPDTQSLFIPPFQSRYSMFFEKNKSDDYDRSLYLSVETAENKNIQLIGTSADEAADDQIQSWEAYFGGVITAWMKNNELPNPDRGYWQRVQQSP